MTGKERFFAGILGALMPICAILLTLDLGNIFSEDSGLSTGHLIGFSLQFVIFLFVGGTVAYMHSDEVKAYKLFQIGMATPALLASFTTSNGLNSAITAPTDVSSPTVVESIESGANNTFNFDIISSAHASDNPLDKAQSEQYAMDGGSIVQQVWDGITGKAVGAAKNHIKIDPKKTNTKKEDEKKKEESRNVLPPRLPVATPPAALLNDTIASPIKEGTEPSEVRIETNSVEIKTSAPIRVLSTDEPAPADLRSIERLSIPATRTPPSTAAPASVSNNEKYEQLLRKLRELEAMQREIQQEMRSLRPAG